MNTFYRQHRCEKLLRPMIKYPPVSVGESLPESVLKENRVSSFKSLQLYKKTDESTVTTEKTKNRIVVVGMGII